MSTMMEELSKNSPAAALKVIVSHIRQTPIIDLGQETGIGATRCALSFKLELLQHSGSFKARGAFYSLLCQQLPKAGVAAASGGNHGAAVAYAAHQLGVPAHIFVPEISSKIKIAKIKSFGARITVAGENYAQTVQGCDDYCQQTGALNIHAYDSVSTILGQSTLACEWQDQWQTGQVDKPDTLLVAVGGGGLVAGCQLAVGRDVKLVAVEPQGASAFAAACKAGKPVPIEPHSIAADSLGAAQIGALPFAMLHNHVHPCLVSDEAIRGAQYWLMEKMNLYSEPGGATALAALLSGAYQPRSGEKVGVVLCGGNVDIATLLA